MSQAFLKSIYARAPKGRKFVQKRRANNIIHSRKAKEHIYWSLRTELEAYNQH